MALLQALQPRKTKLSTKGKTFQACGKTGHLANQHKSSRGNRIRRGQRATTYTAENRYGILHTGPDLLHIVPVNINGTDIMNECDVGVAAIILRRDSWQCISAPKLN